MVTSRHAVAHPPLFHRAGMRMDKSAKVSVWSGLCWCRGKTLCKEALLATNEHE